MMKKITLLLILLTVSIGFSQQQIYNLGFEPGTPDGDLSSWTTFENLAPGFEIVTNPDPDGDNPSTTTKVLKLNLVQGSDCYAGAINFHEKFGTWELDNTVTSNLSLSMDVNRSTTAGTIGIKFANKTNGTVFEIADQVTNSVANEWETLTWDISSGSDNNGQNMNIDQMVVFIDFTCGAADRTEDIQLLVDNITWGANKLTDPVTAPTTPNFVTADVAANWAGYINWFNTPADGGGYASGGSWGVADLKTEIGTNTITLKPNYNTYGDGTDPYWANGAIGNKIMEASTYVEPGASFNGVDLTFTGEVVSNTLDAGYTAKFFIKALDPGNGYSDAFGGAKTIDLPASGSFTVTATGTELADGLIVQYGFAIIGLNGNPADEAALGSVVVQGSVLGLRGVEFTDLTVYPNPSEDFWNFRSGQEEIKEIVIYSILGKQVKNIKPNSTDTSIRISELSDGIYFARISSEDASQTVKLVKK